jgi:hypothetical protein
MSLLLGATCIDSSGLRPTHPAWGFRCSSLEYCSARAFRNTRQARSNGLLLTYHSTTQTLSMQRPIPLPTLAPIPIPIPFLALYYPIPFLILSYSYSYVAPAQTEKLCWHSLGLAFSPKYISQKY